MVRLGDCRYIFRGFQHIPSQHDFTIPQSRQMEKLFIRRTRLYRFIARCKVNPRLACALWGYATKLIEKVIIKIMPVLVDDTGFFIFIPGTINVVSN